MTVEKRTGSEFRSNGSIDKHTDTKNGICQCVRFLLARTKEKLANKRKNNESQNIHQTATRLNMTTNSLIRLIYL